MKCINCKNLGKNTDENGEQYDWCELVIDCPDIQMERNCKHYSAATNADRIRGMSDEELAELWYENASCPSGRQYPECGVKATSKSIEDDCKQCWLDWLKQEARDG